MSLEQKVRQQLKALGLKTDSTTPAEILGVEITVCQFIVVVLSIISVVFLFVPIFFIRDFRFIAIFLSISVGSLLIGIWFWIKKLDICEHPEEYDETQAG